jgi:hypothetical protein
LYKQAEAKRNAEQYEEAIVLYSQAIAVEESWRKKPDWLGAFWNQISMCYYRLERFVKF